MGESRLQREARRRGADLRRELGHTIRDLREDAGLTRAAIARAAGLSPSYEGRIESGERTASLPTLVAITAVLGADISIKAYPQTGPRIRDRIQAAMVESMLSTIDKGWTASPEVPVYRPARGVIDLVLSDAARPIVACEFHSQIRRLEQQVRWHREKEASLPSSELWRLLSIDETPSTSRLLVLRSTTATREIATTYEATLKAVYPARTRDAVEALTDRSTPWPGAAIVWMRVEAGRAHLLEGPPRGVRLGR
jgi:transcriptional regulator with XRE-family HTH domain